MSANGYVRQSAGGIVTNATILASLFNAEYNQLQTAFNGASGHDHSGGAGLGQPIDATAGLTGSVLNSSIVTSSLTTVGTIGTGVWQGTAIADAYVAGAAKWNAITSTYTAGVLGGTANALTATITGFSLVTGVVVYGYASLTVLGAATFTVNGGSTVTIKKDSPAGLVDIQAGDWVPGLPLILAYNGTVWISLATIYEAPINVVSGDFTLSFANLQQRTVATTAVNITLPATNTLPPYFSVDLNAYGGAITLIPNGTDDIQGANSNFTVYQGTSGRLYTDSSGHWLLDGTSAWPLPPQVGGTGIANNAASTITITGSHSLGLTLTGTTSITLPTSGTLVNTAVTTLSSLVSVGTLTGGATGAGFTVALGTSTISGILGAANGGTANGFTAFTGPASSTKTFTLPNASDTIGCLGTIQTWTAAQTFNSSKLILAGSSTGTTVLNSGAAAGSSVLTLPVATDTLIGKATTDTLTNKTYDTAGTGNTFKINGTGITAISGNTGTVATTTGTLTNTHIAVFDASGNVKDGGAVPTNNVVAWCTFNGTTTGTNAPTAGSNVTSVTRNGTGDYTINFTNALVDANYAITSNFRRNNATASPLLFNQSTSSSYNPGTSSVRFLTQCTGSASNEDALTGYVVITR